MSDPTPAAPLGFLAVTTLKSDESVKLLPDGSFVVASPTRPPLRWSQDADGEWHSEPLRIGAAPDQAEGPRCDAKNLGINPSSATHVCGLPEGHVGWHQCGDWYDSEPCLNAWPPVGITFDPPDKTREIL